MNTLKMVSLSSGSQGNCTYIGNTDSGVIIDCGISYKKFVEVMKAHGLDRAPIDAVFVTHEHGDHVGGLKTLENGLKKAGFSVPVYMNKETYAASKVQPTNIEFLKGETLFMGSLLIEAHPVPHDAANPVCFLVTDDIEVHGVITDLGKPTVEVGGLIARCHQLLLEFNHDEEMLMGYNGYHYRLKQRIRGAFGHLSNEQASRLLLYGGQHLKRLIIGHLSTHTNRVDVAMAAARLALQQKGIGAEIELGNYPFSRSEDAD